jgi:membrane-bound ClpP family serine protease
VIGCILIVLGLVFFVARGSDAALVLPVIGIVLLIAGLLCNPRKKKIENITSDTT